MKRTTPDFDPEAFLAKVGRGRTLATYAKNKKIFSQGEPADAVFYILSGTVKLTVVSKQGKEAVVAILGPQGILRGRLSGRSAAAHGRRFRHVIVLHYAAGEVGAGSCPQK
jgi:CRP/FNR family transcriptional regulator, cyclic AMP receptor protein